MVLKKYIKRSIEYFLGKRKLQPLFEALYNLSLYGMNIGGGSNVNSSGEMWAINYIINYLLPNNKPIIIFDVGANVGCYTLKVIPFLRERVNTKIYCFEPSKYTFKTLMDNLSNYKNVKLFNFGFSDKKESVILYSNKKGSGLASIYNRRLNHFDIDLKYKELIHLKSLDNFCKNKGIDLINFLKLDTEGHEYKVLKGAKDLISKNLIDFIQFEFGGANIDSRTYFQDFYYLLVPYYKIYRILKDGLMTIDNYKETHENFITTNFLAISKKISDVQKKL